MWSLIRLFKGWPYEKELTRYWTRRGATIDRNRLNKSPCERGKGEIGGDMNKELIREWIFALRSGCYTPVERGGKFYGKDDRCGCGVGVLGKILGLKDANVLVALCNYSIDKDGMRNKKDYLSIKALTIRKKLGLPKEELHKISEAYEQGASFEDIADYLEAVILEEAPNQVVVLEDKRIAKELAG